MAEITDRKGLREMLAKDAYARMCRGGVHWEDASESTKDEFRAEAKAILAALETAGLVVVPKAPTDAMFQYWVETQSHKLAVVWEGLLDASPFAPKQEGE